MGQQNELTTTGAGFNIQIQGFNVNSLFSKDTTLNTEQKNEIISHFNRQISSFYDCKGVSIGTTMIRLNNKDNLACYETMLYLMFGEYFKLIKLEADVKDFKFFLKQIRDHEDLCKMTVADMRFAMNKYVTSQKVYHKTLQDILVFFTEYWYDRTLYFEDNAYTQHIKYKQNG